MLPSSTLLVARFDQPAASDAAIAGGKGASLCRMTQAGLPVPPGFVICAGAFREFLQMHCAVDQFDGAARALDVENGAALRNISEELREFILSHVLPAEIEGAICDGYLALGEPAVAVRSSAVSEDGAGASFAGQQETFLNVRGAGNVGRSVRQCWASFFAPRALFYRAQKGSLADLGMAVVVQEMVIAEMSGVLFTADPVHRRRDHMVIEAVAGAGEALVSGEVTPDHYVVDRDTGAIVRRFLPQRPPEARRLSGGEVTELWRAGVRLESFFGKPQDIEWCIRGGELFLLQSRPITTL